MFDKEIAHSLISALDKHWINTPADFGMLRPSYSEEEEEAAQFFIHEAKKLDIPTFRDCAGNYYVVLEGKEPSLPAIVSGSHVDSVPRGGRYDGPAGVVAAFSILADFKKRGFVPPQTVCAMIVRGEEGAWFGQVSVGAKLSIGDIAYEKLQQLRRANTNISLQDSMKQIGLEPDMLKNQPVLFPVYETACFIELHIEQGPLLKDKNIPVGIVTGIRGNIRYREVKCVGEAGHTGTVPHHMRKDAVRASVYLLSKLEEAFTSLQEQGKDIVFTFPVANTGASGAHTTIPFDFRFAIEVRSQSLDVLTRCERIIAENIKTSADKYNVKFEVPNLIKSLPAVMSTEVQDQLSAHAKEMDLSSIAMPSGAGHDTAVFANAGVPSGMIFVRHNGISHNPAEDMPFEDFSLGTELLAQFMQKGYFPKNGSVNRQSFIEALLNNGARLL